MTRERLPNRRPHQAFEVAIGGIQYMVGVGRRDDGQLAEVFLSSGKSGVAIEAWARDAAVLISLALQHGCSAETIQAAITREDDGSPSGPIGVLLDMIEPRKVTPC